MEKTDPQIHYVRDREVPEGDTHSKEVRGDNFVDKHRIQAGTDADSLPITIVFLSLLIPGNRVISSSFNIKRFADFV
jgi:hypothetical protein